jgi:hypothetical protein
MNVMEMSYGPSGRGMWGDLGDNKPEVVRDVIARRPGDQYKRDVEH